MTANIPYKNQPSSLENDKISKKKKKLLHFIIMIITMIIIIIIKSKSIWTRFHILSQLFLKICRIVHVIIFSSTHCKILDIKSLHKQFYSTTRVCHIISKTSLFEQNVLQTESHNLIYFSLPIYFLKCCGDINLVINIKFFKK